MADATVGLIQELTGELKPADYLRLARRVRAASPLPGTQPVRLAVLSSFTAGFVEPYLVVEGIRQGFRIETYYGAFGQFEQELGDGGSFYEFRPDMVLLAMRPEDVDPDALTRYYASGGQRFTALASTIANRLAQCARLIRSRSTAPILVGNFAGPAVAPLGLFDANSRDSLTYALAQANRQLREHLAGIPGVVIWDYEGLVRGEGASRWTDPRLWALGRIAVAADRQASFAGHLVRTIAGVLRKPAKCLVLDLDNTLWGGVIGDDGLGGIQLGDDFPGNVFKAFQRSVLALMDRGILLAVASKNEADVVDQAFRDHPEMLIRHEHVAAWRVNWEPKSQNLRAIALELNIGSDALVLFDDNPVERAEVRAQAPEVGVIEVPADPLAYGRSLAESGFFDQVALSAEDRTRTSMYQQERERRDFEQAFESPEAFLRSLSMEAEVGRADGLTLGRIAQLVEKTNQFNLTTRRHTGAELATMANDENHVVAWLRTRDRFGDQGLICVGVLKRDGPRAVVDTFLMSCRVMNRHVEHAFMSYLIDAARSWGCGSVVGDYLPTKKNRMVAEFYPGLGFHQIETLTDGGVRYSLDLNQRSVSWPPFIRRLSAE